MTLLLSEACLFVIRMEDSFDFHLGKRLAFSHIFWFPFESVIVLCIVVLYFMSILVLQSS